MVKEKILSEEIKMFLVGDVFRIYGKTKDVSKELHNMGAEWNPKTKKLEMSEENFQKLDIEIQNKVFAMREKQRQMSLENISHILLAGEVKAYLKDGEYQIYGKTKDIYKDLHNVGFELSDNNYAMKEDDFEKTFSNEVKEFVNEYATANDYNTQTEETFEEEETEENSYLEEQEY